MTSEEERKMPRPPDRGVLMIASALVCLAAPELAAAQPMAPTHRDGCHRWHSCPSDHATYRWRGLLCVAPYSDKRNSTFRQRVRYDGRTYYCKR